MLKINNLSYIAYRVFSAKSSYKTRKPIFRKSE